MTTHLEILERDDGDEDRRLITYEVWDGQTFLARFPTHDEAFYFMTEQQATTPPKSTMMLMILMLATNRVIAP